MAKYTIISDVGQAITNILRDCLTPEPIDKAEKIGICEPKDRGDYVVGIHPYDIKEDFTSQKKEPIRLPDGSEQDPPTMMELYYMISVSSKSQIEVKSAEESRIIGKIIQIFKDNQVIPKIYLPEDSRIDDIPVSMIPLEMEEKVKIWTMFGESYKLSVFYLVGPVAIDSEIIRKPEPRVETFIIGTSQRIPGKIIQFETRITEEEIDDEYTQDYAEEEEEASDDSEEDSSYDDAESDSSDDSYAEPDEVSDSSGEEDSSNLDDEIAKLEAELNSDSDENADESSEEKGTEDLDEKIAKLEEDLNSEKEDKKEEKDTENLDEKIAKLEEDLNSEKEDKKEEKDTEDLDEEIAKLEEDLNSEKEDEKDDNIERSSDFDDLEEKLDEDNKEQNDLDSEIADLENELNSGDFDKKGKKDNKSDDKEDKKDELDDDLSNLEDELNDL